MMSEVLMRLFAGGERRVVMSEENGCGETGKVRRPGRRLK
jgi:hypothetical protein